VQTQRSAAGTTATTFTTSWLCSRTFDHRIASVTVYLKVSKGSSTWATETNIAARRSTWSTEHNRASLGIHSHQPRYPAQQITEDPMQGKQWLRRQKAQDLREEAGTIGQYRAVRQCEAQRMRLLSMLCSCHVRRICLKNWHPENTRKEPPSWKGRNVSRWKKLLAIKSRCWRWTCDRMWKGTFWEL
jgi:hypothetical protein